MEVSETTRKIYDGIARILKENGQSLSKAQTYAIENLAQTIEETTEKRCCEQTEKILAKKDALMKEQLEEKAGSGEVSEATIKKVNEMVEARIEKLKKDIPQVLDYARMKKLEGCVETIKECVGYRADEQVERVASESAKMLSKTKALIETQAKQISEKAASLNESVKQVKQLNEKLKQMQLTIEAKEKQIVESTRKNMEFVNEIHELQKKVEHSKKVNETIEEKRKSEALKFYLEEKISKYPKYEADLLRKHFQNAKSRAEIDENFSKALTMVQERRDAMRTVSAIPLAKVNSEKVASQNNTISGGETIVGESGGQGHPDAYGSMYDDSFVDIDLDSDSISNEEMQDILSRL